MGGFRTLAIECFPFPDPNETQKPRIRELAEQLDKHRKDRQAEYSDLTMTGMYNVLEKLRAGDVLTDKEKVIHEHGLVSVLKELHGDLDRAVFDAYGWNDLAEKLVGLPGATTPLPDKPEAQAEAEEELLKRLVALNTERAAEEKRGLVRWLRPEFQNPQGHTASEQTEMETATITAPASKEKKAPWPKSLTEQMQTLRQKLNEQTSPITPEALAQQFTRANKKKVSELLETLAALGHARVDDQGGYTSR